MRVLLTNHFPLVGAGSGGCTREFADALRQAGHSVHVLLADDKPTGDEPFPTTRVYCSPDDATADLKFSLPTLTIHPRSQLTFSDLTDEQIADYRDAMRAALVNITESFDPEIIHCQHAWVLGTLALEMGVPYVVSVQGTDLAGYRQDERYRYWMEQALENACRLVVGNRAMHDEVVRLFDVEPRKITVLPPPVHVEGYAAAKPDRARLAEMFNLPSLDGPLVVYAGRLSESHGVQTLLEAATLFEPETPGVTTLVVGDGPAYRNFEMLARRLRLRNLYFTGWADYAEHRDFLAAADVVVLPTPLETFDVVALQALSCGSPVIACNAGGLPEWIDDEVGRIVPPRDPAALSAAIMAALHHGWKQSKGPVAMAAAREKFDVYRRLPEWLALYASAIKERCW